MMLKLRICSVREETFHKIKESKCKYFDLENKESTAVAGSISVSNILYHLFFYFRNKN